MGKKTNVTLGIIGGFIGLIILVAAFGPRDESGKLEYIGGPPPQLNSSGLTPAQIVESSTIAEHPSESNSKEIVAIEEEVSSINTDNNGRELNSDLAEINYGLDLMVSNCMQGVGVDMDVCDSDIKRNYDFFCLRYGDAMIETCLKAQNYLTSRGVI